MSEQRILEVTGATKGRSIEQERHIRKDIRSHQGMKVSEKFIEKHCKAKGRPIGVRGSIYRESHVLYAQEVPRRGRSHQKRRNKEEHTSRGEASGRVVNGGASHVIYEIGRAHV